MSDAVIVQAIATAGAVVVVGIPLWWNSHVTRQSVGRKNGHGTLQDQNAALIELAQEHEKLDTARFDAIDKRLVALERGTRVA